LLVEAMSVTRERDCPVVRRNEKERTARFGRFG
jgi:hypothetical protein